MHTRSYLPATFVYIITVSLLLLIPTNSQVDSHGNRPHVPSNPRPLEPPGVLEVREFDANNARPGAAAAVFPPLPNVVQPAREEIQPTWDRKDVTPLDKLLLDDTIWRFQSIPSLRIPVLRAPYPTFGMVMPLPFWWTATERFYPVNVDHLDFQLTSVKNYILEAAVSRCKHIITSRVGLSAYTFRWAHEEPRLAKLAWNYLRGDSTDTATAGRTGTSGTTLEFAEQPSALWSTSTAERFRKRHAPYSMDASRSTALETVLIAVRTPGSDWPSIDMDESLLFRRGESWQLHSAHFGARIILVQLTEPENAYSTYQQCHMIETSFCSVSSVMDALLVDRHGILLVANQTWGAIRGLESLSQLMWRTSDGSQVYINQTLIHDRPRFAHRGLLIDTSRHYISKSIMLLNLEAMAYNKLNVLHWHIVDDSSYPYQSSVFPELSKKGAFSDRQIYTASDIKEIVEFARMRGIRVLPEFDIPGHTRSLAYSKPELLAQCRPEDDPTIYFGPLNPFANETFAFLKALLEEIVDLFPDEYVHLGGDEVEPECWEMDTEIEKARRRLGAAGFQYHEYFWRRVQNTMTDIGVQKPGKQRKIIIWQEVLQHVSEVLDSLVMQIWKPDSAMDIPHTKHLIYSSCWYLDNLFRIRNWGSYYLCDPETKLGPQSAGRRIILGGEASMWSEYQSDDTILQKIWPVTSGIAERLWSPYFVDSLERVGPRIEEQRCRMIGRGIPQSVLLGPGSCDPPGVLSSTLNAPDVGDGQSQFALLGEGIFNDGHLSLSLISCAFYLVIGAITGSLITLALSCFSASFRPRLNGAWPRRFSLTRLFCAAVIITTTLFFVTMYIV